MTNTSTVEQTTTTKAKAVRKTRVVLKRKAKKVAKAGLVWVRAYVRKNGTHVAGHYRSAPVRR